ncbi:MAG: hypothetical protein M3N14_10640 [Bacteroidota bacterium]|nr:hypothetical protein [Bacteroidota bacterium]
MITLISKTAFLTLFVCCITVVAKAQLGYNYSQYDIGFAAGFNQANTDAETKKSTPSVHFNLTFNQTPYTNFVFEAQLGRLAGGDSLKATNGLQFNNDFSAFIFRGQLQAGEFIDYSNNRIYNAIKNVYASAGVGYVINRITSVSRNTSKIGNYIGGDNSSQEFFIPVRIGYEFKLFNMYNQPSVKVDLGYGYNFVLGDNLDGVIAGKHNDAYSQFTIGVKFAIGNGTTSYRKQIQY